MSSYTETMTIPESNKSVEPQSPKPKCSGKLASGVTVQENNNYDKNLLAEAMKTHDRPEVPPPELPIDSKKSTIISTNNISEQSIYISLQRGSKDKEYIEKRNVHVQSKISNTQENNNGSTGRVDIGNNTHSHSEREITADTVCEFGNRDINYKRTLTQGEGENKNEQEEKAKSGEQEEKAKLEEPAENPEEHNAHKYRGGIYSGQKIPLP